MIISPHPRFVEAEVTSLIRSWSAAVAKPSRSTSTFLEASDYSKLPFTAKLLRLILRTQSRSISPGRSFAQHFVSVLAVRCHLTLDHAVIFPARVHELFVVAAFHHASVFHEEDQVGAADGGEAMRNHKGGSSGEQIGHRSLDELLAFRVEVAGGFVEDQDLRRRENRPGDGEPLLLPAGEFDAALAHERFVLIGKFDDE